MVYCGVYMSSFKDILKPNQLFALLAKGLEGIKVIGVNVIVARSFGPETYGKFSFVIGLVSLVALIAEYRLINIMVKEIVKTPRLAGEVIGSSLIINLFFSILGFFILILISYLYSDDDIIHYALIIFSLTYFYKIPRAYRAYFVATGKNIYNVVSELSASIICFTSIILVMSVNDGDIYKVMALRTLDYLYVYITIMLCFYITVDKLRVSFSKIMMKKLFFLALPLVISGFVLVLFQRLDVIMIKYFLGDEQVGVYSASMNYMMIFSIPTMVLSESLAPKIFASDSRVVRLSFLKSISLIGALMSVLMLLTSREAIVFIYGQGYVASIGCALVLSVAPFLIGLGSSAGQLIIKDGVQKSAVVKSLIACVVNIILNFLLIPWIGIIGAALATVISLFVAFYLSHFFISNLKEIFFEQSRALFGNLCRVVR